MIGDIVVLATWSILMIVLGMVIRRKDNDSYIEQLKEYIGLLENKENAESLLNDFIERMKKE